MGIVGPSKDRPFNPEMPDWRKLPSGPRDRMRTTLSSSSACPAVHHKNEQVLKKRALFIASFHKKSSFFVK